MEKTFELPYPTKAMLTYSRALLSNKRKPAIEATIKTTLTTKNFFGAQWENMILITETGNEILTY